MSDLREEFECIVRTNVKRNGINKLLEHLRNTDFYTAPASTRYHNSEPEGLVKHSIRVFEYLEYDLNDSDVSLETIAIVSLFHDLCKLGYYKVEYRNNKNERGLWEKVPYYTVDDKLPYGHGEKSVFMLQSFLRLTLEEAMAIRWHMGAYVGQQDWNTLSNAFSEFPLAMHLHFADMKATYLK